MPMSEEARKAQSERMKARHAANRAQTTQPQSEFDEELVGANGAPGVQVFQRDRADDLSRAEIFRARMASKPSVTTHDELAAVVGEASPLELQTDEPQGVEHTSAGLVWMYKQETWGWHRRRFSRNSLTELLVAGLLPYCGDCGSPQCPGLPNECTKGRKYAYRTCPVVGCNGGNPKKFFDIGASPDDVLPQDDPFAIHDDVYAQSTPETRTKAMLDAHIRAYHEQEAMMRGLFNIVPQQQVTGV